MASTLAQQRAIAIVPKFSAALSVMSSSTISMHVLRRRQNDRQKTYQRLLLGMSMCDMMSSSAWFFTTWPIPRGTPGVWGAVGNQQTCSAQGFFTQFSLAIVLYNASLAIYYGLVIVLGWNDDHVRRIEPILHAFPLLSGLGTCLASVSMSLFNTVGWDCWIGAMPLGCLESWKNNGVTTCTRGDNASLFQWVFFYGPLWGAILLVTFLMFAVYRKVRQQERVTDRYVTSRGERAEEVNRKNSRKVAYQGLLYVGAFYVNWTFPTILQIFIVSSGTAPFPLLFLTAITVPVQGFFNLLVYIRPSYLAFKRRRPDCSCIVAFFFVLMNPNHPELSMRTTVKTHHERHETSVTMNRIATEESPPEIYPSVSEIPEVQV